MDNKENLEQLLHNYGYPKQAIHRFMQDAEGLDYEEVKKRILPYRDITARKS
ncbi:hypothetical protein JMM81_07905 [Bacillus sp. V3B]|uniref:hypothetical protein n=1 Tax=Bacillus sp. V3B TaxID=2804915 RepID=UPI002108D86E|nr:hypothetical protein [Bacillus sp. V3B]MCQ6274887.1 hypothetical protein [Bacillus sp. V3B]